MAATEPLSLRSRITLNDSNEIPILGLGTYEMTGAEAYKAVTWALEAGYRLIDSAEWYYNEKECGQAIRDFIQRTETPRSEIFYTTKLMSNRGLAHARLAIRKSLNVCGLDYIDLYLLHSPLGGPEMRRESWQAAIEARNEGLVRSIGVSNYGTKHIREILTSEVLPALNQIDLHPFMARSQIVTLCRKHGIHLEAWGPLVRGLRFKHRVIAKAAAAHNKTPAQILLRYSIQKGYIAIPKSVSKERIMANTRVFDFELTENEMDELEDLDEYLITDWDPTDAE